MSRSMRSPRSSIVALFVALPLFAQAAPGKSPSRSTSPTVAQKRAALENPANAFWKTRAPDTVVADIETSKGTFTVELIRSWAPVGVDRFYNLARAGYFDNSRFFRVVYKFVAQFGIAGNPAIASLWARQPIAADSVQTSNARGTIAFAQSKPADRTTNVFVNLRDSPNLDSLGFAPVGRVVEGMDVVDSLYSGYGDIPSSPPPLGNPRRLFGESNKYLDGEFPKLDRLVRITIRTPKP
jgi:peptidyl-prolyl cis-trans isomerase A (cyclophilin A)